MATIKHIFKGESLSMLFAFPLDYDMSRIQSHGIWIGRMEFTGVIIGQGIELKLTSLQTDLMSGNQRVSLWIDDSQLGVRKPYVGDIAVGNTNALPDNESTSEVYDVIVNVDISVTSIEAGDLMFNYVKGDKGDPFLYSDFTPEQKAELQQPATDAIASIQEVELAVETAEGLRVQAELNRQTNTSTAISNAEQATDDANDAASLANEKAGLANNAAILADQKATLANDAATNANTKAGLADTAATNADNARLAIQVDLAGKLDKTSIATQPEAEANTENTKFMTALRVFQNFVKNATTYVFSTLNTTSKTITGAINELFAKSVDLESLSIRKLVLPLGATYNTTTKLYSLNGLTDITEAEMVDIYNYFTPYANSTNWNACFVLTPIRTNTFTINNNVSIGATALQAFNNCSKIEVFRTNIPYGKVISDPTAMFRNCIKLIEVNYIQFLSSVTAAMCTNTFEACSALVTCNIRNLKTNISFAWSPLLSLESLQYLIQYRANGTTAITITVHPTVFAKLTDNTNYPTWYAVNQDALTKYITFASA